MAEDQREALFAVRVVACAHIRDQVTVGPTTDQINHWCRDCGLSWVTFPDRSVDNPSMAQTSKEKQEAFRARQAMLGNTEVRGIFAPPELHPAIKELARQLVKEPQYRCVKCGYKGPLQIKHQRPNGTGECGYIAARVVDSGEPEEKK